METQGLIKSNNWMRFALLALILAVALPFPSIAFAEGAETFGEAVEEFMTTQMNPLPTLISALCYIVGLFMIANGALKLKAHADNPGNNKIQPAIARLMVGGALAALPTLTGWVFRTLMMTGEPVEYMKFGTTFKF